MRLQILVLLFLNIFRIKATSFPADNFEDENTTLTTTVYPHRVGIKNHNNNCYMNAIFSCLYSIPFFHSTVYKVIRELPVIPNRADSVLVALADIFVRMRMNKSAVGISSTMFPAIRNEMDWTVGGIHCALDFWLRFIEKMPQEFQEISRVQLKQNYFRKSDHVLIKSIDQIASYIDIPTPKSPLVFSQFVANKFLDVETEDFIIEVEDQREYSHILTGPITEKVNIPMYNTLTIENTPNVLIFNVKRQGWNPASGNPLLNTVPIIFDNISIRGEVYWSLCAVLYNGETAHYYAVVNDSLTREYFIHNDAKITRIDVNSDEGQSRAHLSELFSQNSTMVFYVKASAHIQLITESIASIRKNEDVIKALSDANKNLKSILQISRKRAETSLGSKSKSKKTKMNHDINEEQVNDCEEKGDEDGPSLNCILNDILENFEFDMEKVVQQESSETLPGIDDLSDAELDEMISFLKDDESADTRMILERELWEVEQIKEIERELISANTSQVQQQPQQPENINLQQQEQESINLQQPNPNSSSVDQQPLNSYNEHSQIIENLTKQSEEVLGTRNFTFAPSETKSFALESVLTAMASNSFFLIGLFRVVSEGLKLKLEYQLSVILIQMLSGCKNISLDGLIALLRYHSPKIRILDCHPISLKQKIKNCLEVFCLFLDNSLMKLPSLKTIIYSELVTDEPISVKTINSSFFNISASGIIQPRPGKFTGIYFDQNFGGNRLRSILNSKSHMFPIIIERTIQEDASSSASIDNNPFRFSTNDFVILGSIFYDQKGTDQFVAEFASNHIPNSSISFDPINGGLVHEFSESVAIDHFKTIFTASQTNSHVIFVMNKSFWSLQPIKYCNIPKFLADDVVKKIQREDLNNFGKFSFIDEKFK